MKGEMPMTRKQLKAWKENNDPIKVFIYDLLGYVKILLIILIVYIAVLTFGECVFTWQNASDNAVGSIQKGVQRPWLSKPTYNISNQDQSSESLFVTVNM
jgi:hypothetical protein